MDSGSRGGRASTETEAPEGASEKSVLPEAKEGTTVKDVGEIMVEPDIDFTTSTVRGEERKA